VHHRGTPLRPGLVLGLAPGGAVKGVAYQVADDDWDVTYAYLKVREQPTETYVERRARVRLDDGRHVQALTFLSDRRHPQWAGVLSLEAQADLIAGASGLSGRNVDYLADLVEHLRAEHVSDPSLETLLTMVEARERGAD
jgi:cation transport protein ChaC